MGHRSLHSQERRRSVVGRTDPLPAAAANGRNRRIAIAEYIGYGRDLPLNSHPQQTLSQVRWSIVQGHPSEARSGPSSNVIRTIFYIYARPANLSFNFDHRRRPDTLRTAIATAFFWPTSTTSRLPRVTPV